MGSWHGHSDSDINPSGGAPQVAKPKQDSISTGIQTIGNKLQSNEAAAVSAITKVAGA